MNLIYIGGVVNKFGVLIFLSVIQLLAANSHAETLPKELLYTVNGTCTDGNITFRALELRAVNTDHTVTVEVFAYLNNDGTGSVALPPRAPVATTWTMISSPAAPDIINLKVEKLGTIQYVSAQISNSQYPTISVQTENSYFQNLPVLTGNLAYPAFQMNAPFSSTGQTIATYCSQQ